MTVNLFYLLTLLAPQIFLVPKSLFCLWGNFNCSYTPCMLTRAPICTISFLSPQSLNIIQSQKKRSSQLNWCLYIPSSIFFLGAKIFPSWYAIYVFRSSLWTSDNQLVGIQADGHVENVVVGHLINGWKRRSLLWSFRALVADENKQDQGRWIFPCLIWSYIQVIIWFDT